MAKIAFLQELELENGESLAAFPLRGV